MLLERVEVVRCGRGGDAKVKDGDGAIGGSPGQRIANELYQFGVWRVPETSLWGRAGGVRMAWGQCCDRASQALEGRVVRFVFECRFASRMFWHPVVVVWFNVVRFWGETALFSSGLTPALVWPGWCWGSRSDPADRGFSVTRYGERVTDSVP